MKSPITLAAIAALALTACGTKNASSPQQADTDADTGATTLYASMLGQWSIENVVINDTLYARPAEISPGDIQYINFNNDSTFSINTNCNMMAGQYVIHGDSIRMENISITEMACDNMLVEELLCKVLPSVNIIDMENDSITRLNTPDSGYIVLRRSPVEVKSAD
ncbi:MAG: META domain-containing protein [Muribaculaceae bacterium]